MRSSAISYAPRFSIIVPIHNVDQYLKACLNSLVKQTYRNIEILCIVNGSVDSSEEIVRDFLEKDSRISCFVLDKAGVSYARNYGIRVAKGEFVSFIDADDWVDERLYELVDRKLKQEEVDCLIYGLWDVFGEKEERNDVFGSLIKKVGQKPFCFSDYPLDCINLVAFAVNKVVRRQLLLDQGIFFGENLRLGEDLAFCTELYHKCQKLVCLDESLYFYRRRRFGDSATTKVPLLEYVKSCEWCLSKVRDLAETKRIVARFIKGFNFVYRCQGCPSDKESVTAMEALCRKLQFFSLFSFNKDVRRLIKYLIKAKLKQALGNMFSIKRTPLYRTYKIGGWTFRVLRASSKKAIQQRTVVDDNHQVVLNELRQRKEKIIRVGFIVGEIQKWKSQALFDLMQREDNFIPQIVIVPFFMKGEKVNDVEMRIAEAEEFFRNKGMLCIIAWDFDRKESLPFDDFQLDIVFYQQPWGIDKKHFVSEVSKRSLCCYVPYYVPNYGNLEYDCIPFHKLLFRYYVLNKEWKELYLTAMLGCEEKLVAVGHPILDFYLKRQSVENKRYVVYAPHHSLKINSIGYATFNWSGRVILEFAQQHSEINWVFKPHPKLKQTLIDSPFMTKEEVDEYWNAWKEFGEVYEGGDYLELFNDSRCLITDCGSFLVEYFYTGKPVIHLSSQRAEEPVAFLKEILDCYYTVSTTPDLLLRMKEVLLESKDVLAGKRENKVMKIKNNQECCSKNIIKDIKRTLFI